MKKAVINSCLNLIKKYRQVSDDELAVIKYGLEGIYLTITKTIIILVIAALLGYFIQTLVFFIVYGLIKTFSYGLHAKKSWMCWVSSVLIFNIIPIIAANYEINFYLKSIICILGTILIFKNSPADTYKRPIVSKRKRKKLKLLSTITCLIYAILSLTINNTFFSNCFIYSIVLQNVLISPVTYKLFKLPYNNYIVYLKNHPELNNL